MRRSTLFAAALVTLALLPTRTASAQLIFASPLCTNGNAHTVIGSPGCGGAFAGDTKAHEADILGLLSTNLPGTWTYAGATNDVGFGPFAGSPTGGTGTLSFDTPLFGTFVVGLQSGNAFSIYGLNGGLNGILTLDYTTAGTALNDNGAPNDLSYATLYTYNPNVVPEPSTYALLGTGLVGLAGVARRRRAAKA